MNSVEMQMNGQSMKRKGETGIMNEHFTCYIWLWANAKKIKSSMMAAIELFVEETKGHRENDRICGDSVLECFIFWVIFD
jgi:hypothetical protein